MRAIIGAPGDSAGTLWTNVLGVDDYERQVTVKGLSRLQLQVWVIFAAVENTGTLGYCSGRGGMGAPIDSAGTGT